MAAFDDLPRLNPPRGTLHPTFVELHGVTLFVAGCLVALLILLVLRVARRSRPAARPDSPRTIARRALVALRSNPADAGTCRGVAHAVRAYLAARLAPDRTGLTSEEILSLLAHAPWSPADATARCRDLLTACDAAAFSAAADPCSGPHPADEAGSLLADWEARSVSVR
jgi:hypothetical protein